MTTTHIHEVELIQVDGEFVAVCTCEWECTPQASKPAASRIFWGHHAEVEA